MERPDFYIKERFFDIAYDKAKEVLERDTISLDSFSGLYDPQKIAQAKEYVFKREEAFIHQGQHESRGHKLGVILEAIVHQHIEQSNWFGEYAQTIKPSRYDDVKHGVDEIIEFQEPEKPTSHLALGIDATLNTDKIGTKLKKILTKIDQGQMTQIEYFISSDGSYRGELNRVPLLIVGADENTIKNLADTWINEPRRLAEHPFQLQVLEEVMEQLYFFAEYAEARSHTDIAARYRQALAVLKPFYLEQNHTGRNRGQRDGFHTNLMAQIDNLRNLTLK